MSGNAWSNAPVEQRRMVLIIVAFFIILFVLGILTQPKPSAPTIVPSPTLTPSLNSVQLGSLVKPICDGIGINTMNIYSNISGIHPIISSNPEPYNFPEKWSPTNINLTELVLCVDNQTEVHVDDCGPYSYGTGGNITVPRYDLVTNYILREAHTGIIISSTKITEQAEQCPEEIRDWESGYKIVGGMVEVSFNSLIKWLSIYVIK